MLIHAFRLRRFATPFILTAIGSYYTPPPPQGGDFTICLPGRLFDVGRGLDPLSNRFLARPLCQLALPTHDPDCTSQDVCTTDILNARRHLLSPSIPGRGDTARTCDLMVPNHPLYQLSYTPIILPRNLFSFKMVFLHFSSPKLRMSDFLHHFLEPRPLFSRASFELVGIFLQTIHKFTKNLVGRGRKIRTLTAWFWRPAGYHYNIPLFGRLGQT